ncbi:hypothetical protein ED733_008046 [Metarhizium rileyi]|uniref:Cytochrome P450 n=1 Tax=Metarhizium rileyi (strain RCEF 4871) TaxID=1649241 RepID=A0A5C6GJW6_METRR|nr:hypothetical protein ED733_008046 [Metarhizium rileyi]
MAHNCKTHFEDIDTNSPLDVFESIDVLIYQITLRQLGSADIANDPDLLRSTLGMFLRSEGGSALEVMFPSLPTPSKRQRMRAGEELHMIYSNIMQNRRDTGRTEHDAMQAMMDAGESDVDISVFIMGATVAGLFNTTIMLVWTLMFLSRNSEWYQKVQDEVFAAVEKRRCSEAESGADILGRLAVEDWEGEFTMVNYCLRETIRLAMHGAAFRKNTGSKDIEIAGTGQVIPKNSYAVYPVADVHLNPEVYSHPHTWDPSRFLPSRAEDKKESHAYLGWGSGLHPCLGMRFAKVEVTMCVAMFFALFNFKLVDKQGSVENARLPTLDHGRVSAARMPGQVFLKCERRM